MEIYWVEYFQFFSLLLSIVYSRGLKKFNISGIILWLVLACFVDFIGENYLYFHWKNNYLLYNCYLIISYPVTFFIFFKILAYNGWIKLVFLFINFLALAFFLLNLFLIQGIFEFNTNTLILSEFITALLALQVLIKLFKDDDFNILLYNHPYFWLSGGTLIFSVCILVILGLQRYIDAHKIQIDGENIYQILTPIINIILYASYSYAFFLCNKLTRKLSRQ